MRNDLVGLEGLIHTHWAPVLNLISSTHNIVTKSSAISARKYQVSECWIVQFRVRVSCAGTPVTWIIVTHVWQGACARQGNPWCLELDSGVLMYYRRSLTRKGVEGERGMEGFLELSRQETPPACSTDTPAETLSARDLYNDCENL